MKHAIWKQFKKLNDKIDSLNIEMMNLRLAVEGKAAQLHASSEELKKTVASTQVPPLT